jgi:hypothetical protein
MFVPIEEALEKYHNQDVNQPVRHERKRKNVRYRDTYAAPSDQRDEGREYFSVTTENDALNQMHHPLLSNEVFFELTQH